MPEPTIELSPRSQARLAGLFYLLTILAGIASVFLGPSPAVYSDICNLFASVCYSVVTVLFYRIFKPVSRRVALLATAVSFMGCAMGALDALHVDPFHFSNLVLFGIYCLLIGYLTFKSIFLPRVLGILMIVSGLCWATFLSPTFAHSLVPYTMLLGVLGELSLTLWLLVKGLDVQRWRLRSVIERH